MSGVRFLSSFDRPAALLGVPNTLSDGSHPALGLVDGFVRGRRIVGRFAEPISLLGLRVQPTNQRIDVSIQFHYDLESIRWWDDRVDRAVILSPPGNTRLIRVRGNGGATRAVLLDLSGKDGRGLPKEHSIGWVTLELDPVDVSDEGFVLIEVEDGYDASPEWARDRLTPHAPVGIRVDAIRVAVAAARFVGGTFSPRSDERNGLASTGGLSSKTVNSPRILHNGLLVINPAPHHSRGLQRQLRVVLATRRTIAAVPRKRTLSDIRPESEQSVQLFEHAAAVTGGMDIRSERFRKKVIKNPALEENEIPAGFPPADSTRRPRRPRPLIMTARTRMSEVLPHRIRRRLSARAGRVVGGRLRIVGRAASLIAQDEVGLLLGDQHEGNGTLSVGRAELPILVDVWLADRHRRIDSWIGWPLRLAVGNCRVGEDPLPRRGAERPRVIPRSG